MRSTDDQVRDLVARYAASKQSTADEVTRRHDIVTELLRITGSREHVAKLLDMTPQRISAIVGGVRR